jgi:phage N-6-adenine-methyltransferase
MNQLAVVDVETGEIAEYRPQEALVEQAKDDAVIELAKRTKNWPLLESAVEKKLDDQEDFVNWWRENVSRNHGGKRIKSAERGTWNYETAEKLTGISSQQVSKWAKRLAKRDEYRAALYGVAYRQAMGALLNNFRAQASGKQEWYTPSQYIEAARKVMGAIDLDPASSDEAQKTVRAKRYLTAADNGLNHEWLGRVFLNPPYAAQEVSAFVRKLIEEVEAQRAEQAILLVNNCTDTSWFHEAFKSCAGVCFTSGRISFDNPTGSSASPTQGQAFFYFGERLREFVKVFSAFGLMAGRL